jgi:transcriptional regulator with XRE-family HTH domain
MMGTDVSTSQFGAWLRRQLRVAGLNQSELAEKIGTSTGTVSMWATGKRVPEPASCDLIADALGVGFDVVLAAAGHRPLDEEIALDDPRIEIHGLVDRVKWTPNDVRLVTRVLRTILEGQQGE